MLNQIVLVGRILEKGEDYITLAVSRSFKNAEGEYETDFIDISIAGNMSTNVQEYCQKGDVVGVKGRVEGLDRTLKIVAEKVTFLSASKNKINEEE